MKMSFFLFLIAFRRIANSFAAGTCLGLALVAPVFAQTSPSTPPASGAIAAPEASDAQTGGNTPQADDAQPPVNDAAGTFVFKKQVEEVVLHATVVDDQRRLVTGLGRESFSVFEDGAPQTITSFHRDDVPVALGILIDNSGSMREKREQVNRAVLNLIRFSNPDDQIFVVNFGETAYLDQDFTSDTGLLQHALQNVSTRGTTALYDAVTASAEHLRNHLGNNNNNDGLQRKILLVITDGRDNASRETLQDAARRLQQPNGPILYAIGLPEDDRGRAGRQALESLADSTGGVAFFPATLQELSDISQTLARDIRSQYTIGYEPVNPPSNAGYRAIQVEARASGYAHLKVRTRSGYYAGQPLQ